MGAPGTGKTSMAFAFAEAIGAQIHHIPSQDCNLENLERVARMCHTVPYDWQHGKACAWHVIIVDEADQMSPAAQTFLLSRLDGSNPCPSTIWILTANDDSRFQDRFLSRLIKLPVFVIRMGALIFARCGEPSDIGHEVKCARRLFKVPTGALCRELRALELVAHLRRSDIERWICALERARFFSFQRTAHACR